MKKLCTLLFLSCFFATSHARYTCHWGDEKHGRLTIGFHVGAGVSSIDNISGMLESGDVRPDYSWKKKNDILPVADLYAEYMRGRIGIIGEVGYYTQGKKLTKNSVRETEKYTFLYHYASLGIYMRMYCYKGFYIGFGGRYSINMSPRSIQYETSKFSSYRFYANQTQTHLRETFSGKSEISPGVLVGCEFRNGLLLEAAYHFGAKDMISTGTNKYGYTERKNTTNIFEFKIGYIITIFNYEKERKSWERSFSVPYWKR